MLLRTRWSRLPAAACLCWLAGVLMAATLLADDQAEKPTAEASKQAPAGEQPAAPGATGADDAVKLSLEQQQIAEKFRHFEKVLLRMAELSESSDPRRAALLKKAVKQSGDQLIDVQFEHLVELLGQDQLARAIENQGDLDRDLGALLQLLLSENRARRIEAEKARIREYLKRLGGIIRRQKDLQGRTEEGPDPKGLAGQQGQLAKTTGDLAKDVRKTEGSGDNEKAEVQPDAGGQGGTQGQGRGRGQGQGSGQGQGQAGEQGQGQPQQQGEQPVHKRLEAAGQRMKEAQQKLEQAERAGAVEKQEEALRELQQAKAELEEILRQLREEEIMRMLALLEGRFREMLQLERQVYDGTVRLDKVPPDQRTRDMEIEASRLSGKQGQIVLKADEVLLLLRDEGTAVAFPEAVEQMREDMQQVVQRLARAEVGRVTQAIEEDIIAALEEMIEALKKAQEDTEARQQGEPPPPGQPQDPPLIDTLAELRMIRALQMRVNRRTQSYSKLIEGEQAQQPDLVEALRRLADRQARIHQVTRDLAVGKNK